jgi:uncharacterized protein YndB with AHSA1/START domain
VEVLEVIDEKKLKYSWDYGGTSPHSSAAFKITASGSITQLIFTAYIEPIPDDQPNFLKDTKNGWSNIVNTLREFVEKKNN